MMEKYEVWREVRRIVEWRDGCVFRTELVESGWFDKDLVEANNAYETNLVYSVASTHDTSAPLLQIRRKRRA